MSYAFFLGGQDLEMQEIAKLLAAYAEYRVVDKNLRWGARAMDYKIEIEAALATGFTPVLIELSAPEELGQLLEACLIIDHHGERAGADAPTAIEQVADLVGLGKHNLSRWQQLVSANDKGYVPAMQALDASMSEMQAVRAADRAAQGVTPADERQAAIDIQERQIIGRLTVVHTPLATSSPITDGLERALGGAGADNLLVIGAQNLGFFGEGALVIALKNAFPNGWYGGALPLSGYWGHPKAALEPQQVIDLVLETLNAD
jgi:hypothetical protein